MEQEAVDWTRFGLPVAATWLVGSTTRARAAVTATWPLPMAGGVGGAGWLVGRVRQAKTRPSFGFLLSSSWSGRPSSAGLSASS